MSTALGFLVGERGKFSGARVAIPDTGLIIGRDPKQTDLVVDHPLVSRRHAQITVHTDGKLYLIDLQSRNGTSVNGHRLSAPVPLQPNDKIEFGAEGEVVFIFESAATTSVSGVLKEAFGETIAPVEWKVGDTILDIYEVTGILGQGGMGRVYKVHHKSWNIDLAVKSPLPGLFTEEKDVENFIREAETWVNLNLHPNIVQCHYVRTIGGIPRIFAEYVPGGTLTSWIKNRKLTQLDQILDVAIQFAWGLQAAHEQSIVHQDVKPLNVLMTADGIAKVCDFGLARARPVTGDNAATTPNNMVTMAGFTRAYCSPEQACGEKLSRKTDIWSWAVSVLEIFTGGIVWQNGLQSPEVLKAYRSQIGPKFIVKMPNGLANLLEQCLSVRPDERPNDMREIAKALQNVCYSLSGQPDPRSEPKPTEHLADSLNNRAVSLIDLGKMAEAFALWQQSLKIEPHHPESVYNMGLVEWRSAQIGDDILTRRLGEVCVSNPHKSTPCYLLALVHLERGDGTSAKTQFGKVAASGFLLNEIAHGLREAERRTSYSNINSRTFIGHNNIVGKACLSWDERHVISIGSLPRANDGVDLSLDDRLSREGPGDVVKFWDATTGRCLRSIEGEEVVIGSLSADGQYAIKKGNDCALEYWDMLNWRCLKKIGEHREGNRSVSLSGNGKYAVSTYDGHVLLLWEIQSGHCLLTFKDERDFIESVCLSWDGKKVLVACDDSRIKFLDLAGDVCLQEFKGQENDQAALDVCLSREGRHALSVSLDHQSRATIKLWQVDNGRCLSTYETGLYNVKSICFGRTGLWVLTEDGDSHAIILTFLDKLALPYVAPFVLCKASSTEKDASVGQKYESSLTRARDALDAGHTIIAADFVRTARSLPGYGRKNDAFELWTTLYLHLPRKTLFGGWEVGNFSPICSSPLCFCGESGVVLTGGELWEPRTERCLRVLFDGVRTSVCNENGTLALSGNYDGTVNVWNIATGECIRTFPGRKAFLPWSICISQDSRFALIGYWTLFGQENWALFGQEEDDIKLWDISTGNCLRSLSGHKVKVRSVCLSNDTQYAVSAGTDGTIRFWSLQTGQCLRAIEVMVGPGHGGAWSEGEGGIWHPEFKHSAVCLSDDAKYVLYDDSKNRLVLCDFKTGQTVQTFAGHGVFTNSVSFTKDARFAVSGGDDYTIKVWELATGQCLRTFEGHTEAVESVCLSTDGRYILSGSRDKTVRLWALDWDLEDKHPADWDEGARTYLDTFLTLHTQCAAKLPKNREPTEDEIKLALTRHGKPVWNDRDFQELLHMLGCAGYGWLRPDGVRQELEKMTAEQA